MAKQQAEDFELNCTVEEQREKVPPKPVAERANSIAGEKAHLLLDSVVE